jgi:hypothetical protein
MQNTTTGGFSGNFNITFRTIGATGTVICEGIVSTANSIEYLLKNGSVSGTPTTTATTINTTIGQQIRITHQFSATNSDNRFNTLSAQIKLTK